MGTRAERLAAELEALVEELARTVETRTATQWNKVCEAEGWTVAQTAHHLAGGFPIEMEYVTRAIVGGPLPSYTWEDINRITRDQAARAAGISPSQVLSELRDGAPPTIAYIRALTDEQLDRSSTLGLADDALVTAEHIIERVVLLDHFRAHLRSIHAVGS